MLKNEYSPDRGRLVLASHRDTSEARNNLFSLIEKRYSNIIHLSDLTFGITRLVALNSSLKVEELPKPSGAEWLDFYTEDSAFIKDIPKLRPYAIFIDRKDNFSPEIEALAKQVATGNHIYLNSSNSAYNSELTKTFKERLLLLETI